MKKVKKFKKYLRFENALQILREAAEFESPAGMRRKDKAFEIPAGMRKKDKAFKILRIVFDSQKIPIADQEKVIDLNFGGSDEHELISVTTEFSGFEGGDVQTVYTFSVLTLALILKRVALLHEADVLAQTLGDEEHAIAVDEYEASV